MRAPTNTDTLTTLSESQRTALVTLLTDEDPAVYQVIRQKILSFGKEALPWLKPHTLSNEPQLRRRVTEIMEHLERQSADNHMLAFCLRNGEDLDIEEGCWLLAKVKHTQINPDAYRALLDSYAGDLRERIDFGANPEALLTTVNQYLFSELGYFGNEQNYYDPQNGYLNRVIDRRTGNPISLCLIYLFVARRLGLPMAGIGMPGHFLCRFQSLKAEVYIDAFNRGKLLSRADCIKYLQHTSHGFQESHLASTTPRRMLLRVCSNLHQIYSQLESADETARFQRYIVALAK